MSLTKALWVSVCALWLFVFLWFLRQFNILGSKYDILVNWVSAIGLIFLGVFVGILISEKKIQIRPAISFLIIFTAGFFAAPFVAVAILMVAINLNLSRGIEPLIFGGSITDYLLLYMLLWIKLKKKAPSKSERQNNCTNSSYTHV
ncbi:hypothetical protein HXY32_03145 [Candidatus Bathyarchaeota archaeon]|nr:hypothetical protein [Candidatus Bathyarchaeota archaeon]